MKFVATRTTLEPLKQQPLAGLAEYQREKRFPHEIMRNTNRYRKLVQYFHRDFITLDRADVYIPVDDLLGVARIHAYAHLVVEIA